MGCRPAGRPSRLGRTVTPGVGAGAACPPARPACQGRGALATHNASQTVCMGGSAACGARRARGGERAAIVCRQWCTYTYLGRLAGTVQRRPTPVLAWHGRCRRDSASTITSKNESVDRMHRPTPPPHAPLAQAPTQAYGPSGRQPPWGALPFAARSPWLQRTHPRHHTTIIHLAFCLARAAGWAGTHATAMMRLLRGTVLGAFLRVWGVCVWGWATCVLFSGGNGNTLSKDRPTLRQSQLVGSL